MKTPVTMIATAPRYKPKHVSRSSAERLANAEITHTLLDRVRDHAEQSNHPQQQRQPGEPCDEDCPKPVARRCRPHHVVQRHHVPHAPQLLLVHAGDRRTHGRLKGFRAA
jgi:hypothetical protein